MMHVSAVAVSIALLAGSTATEPAGADRWEIASPDGRIVVTLELLGEAGEARGSADAKRLRYRIERVGRDGRRSDVLLPSPLGIDREDQGFTGRLRFVEAGEAQLVDETYAMMHGKRSLCRTHARRRTLAFRNPEGAAVELILHVAGDGVALRYRFPERSETRRIVSREATGFHLPPGTRAWMQPYQAPSKWTPAYEDYFEDGIEAGTPAPRDAGWALPALFQAPAGEAGPSWVLLAEAAVDESYCGARLAREAPGGAYRIRFPDPDDGNGVGAARPSWTLPWATPWRVILVSDDPAGIVESTLITDLNPPRRVKETDWIRPGRVSWSWWSDHESPRNYETLRTFVDLAAEMGWEYSLVDANWTLMDGGNVRELARYAREKGVGLLLWYNSGGPHNSVTEKPRGCMRDPEVRRFEFQLLARWGIRGVKVDFFHSDKQDMMALYLGILRDAADHRLLVNFHGCTVPRGWSRTYPHLMAMEAVRGAECYTFAREYPERAPAQNTIYPFTRNVVGPMDYTPVALSDDRYPHRTTSGHELALSVVFESGLQHFADRVSAYRDLPEEPKDWLRSIPVAWDDTRLLGGYPGDWVAIARRKGRAWYIGCINGEAAPRDVTIDATRLVSEPGDVRWDLIRDTADGRAFRATTVLGRATLAERMRPYGGLVARLTPREE